MRVEKSIRTGLTAILALALGGCATSLGRSPATCAAIGAGVGAVGGGIGGGFYSADNRDRDHNQLEGAGIAAASTLVGAGLGYLVCSLMEEEPKPEPVRRAAPETAPTPPPAPPPDACSRKVHLQDVNFGNDQSDITSTAAASLDRTIAELKSCPDQRVRVNAYTDSNGSEAYNQALSQRRADSVRSYLLEHGIPASRIDAHGYGEANPIASNDTPEGRAQNRRVELEPIQ